MARHSFKLGFLISAIASVAIAQSIPMLPAATTPASSSDLFAVSQSNVTKKMSLVQAGLPVLNNTALAALPSNTASSIVRLSYASQGDSPPLTYKSSNSPCSLNTGAGDGGSQVPSSDGKCWIADFPSLIDITFWGAKRDGSASITTAFKAAMDYCVSNKNFVIGGSEAPGCTVYIPFGYFSVGTTLHVAPNVSVKADPGAYIQLVSGASSGTNLLDGQYVSGCSTTFNCVMNDQWIEGGTWDCNSNTNAVGFYFPYIQRHFHVQNWHMRNCINGGGYLLIGNGGSTVIDNGAWFSNFVFENATISTASGNYGIAFVGTGLIDSYFNEGMIEDTSTPFSVTGAYNVHLTQIHVWNFTECMNEGFHFTGSNNGQDFLDNDVVDGPLCNATSAYGFDGGGPFVANSLRYDSATFTGLPGTGTFGAFVGAGVALINTGFQLNGSVSVPITGDYANAGHTGMTLLGESTSNVTATYNSCVTIPTTGICIIN